MRYSDICLSYFRNQSAVGRLEGDSVTTVTRGHVGVTDAVRLQLEYQDGIVARACFKADGSVAVLAAAAYVCEQLLGRTQAEFDALDANHIANALQLPQQRFSAAMLVADAVADLMNISQR